MTGILLDSYEPHCMETNNAVFESRKDLDQLGHLHHSHEKSLGHELSSGRTAMTNQTIRLSDTFMQDVRNY